MKALLLIIPLLTPLAQAAPGERDEIAPLDIDLARLTNHRAFQRLQASREPTDQAIRTAGEPSRPSRSLILTDGTHWTLVPRGAVLHLPGKLADRVDARPVGTLLPWNRFLEHNQDWLRTEELTLRQAEGVHAIHPRRVQSWPRQDKLVVGVHRGAPVHVARDESATASLP